MSPRAGGEADKFGLRYEGAWTVWRVLDIIAGDGSSITVEVAGEFDEGAEFLYVRAADGAVEAHQVKRQQGNSNGWTVKSLQNLDIWANAKQHIEKGREFHFASTTPAPKLQELADRARRSASLDDFIKKEWLTKTLKPQFDELAKSDIYGSPAAAWEMLRRMRFHWLDEDSLVSHNAGMSGAYLEGATGRLAAVGLGDLVMQNLGVRLTASDIGSHLSTYGLQRATPQRSREFGEAIMVITSNWRDSVRRELLSPTIDRAEADLLVDLRKDPTTRVAFLVGAAGGGKSATLAQAVDNLLADNVTVLGFRLDRLGDFNTTWDLGDLLGLDASPVSALAAAAATNPSVLVIDQLDAVSLASGRIPAGFSAVEDLVREASAFPNMYIVLVCRQFDVDNDYRIRTLQTQLKAAIVTVAALADGEVNAAVDAMGLDHATLNPQQRELLRLPLHLVLLSSVADEPDALNFQTTAHLFDAYWHRKRQMIEQRKPDVRFMEIITTVANAISDRQELSVPDTILDPGNLVRDGDAFISEHVLLHDGNRIAFFHEAFFDYAFARQWSTKNQTLVEFLTVGEQELFRRAQVRQILHHLRERDTTRYLTELRSGLTSPQIRFHIKEAILAVLHGLADPSTAELQIVLHAAAHDSVLAGRVWPAIRSDGWFARLGSDGQLQRWLTSSTAEERDRAVGILGGAARASADQVAAIIAPHKTHADYVDWLFWAARFADLHISRQLFDLLLDAVRAGGAEGREHHLWLSAYSLADHEPTWAIELLTAYFVEWPGGLTIATSGKVERLEQNDHGLAKLIKNSAAAEPDRYVEALLPYMTAVMEAAATETEPPGFPTDPHFSYHDGVIADTSDADDALYAGMRLAIQQVVRADAVAAEPMLESLAEIKLSGAQSLLYLGLIAGGSRYADWSADLLLEGVDRLFCGTMSNSVWVARQLIEVIAPHVSGTKHQAIEDAVRELRFDWESQHGGYYAFNLLSALQSDRLTPLGTRRLGEYQRKFKSESPAEPEGVAGGWIGPPIAGPAIAHMTDENWRQAMVKHDHDRTDWSTLTGGARELSHVLHQQTKEDPLRFARLALQLDEETNAAYGDAILLGLGEAPAVAPTDEESVFAAVRHIAVLGQASNDRWLGQALRPYLKTVPLDLVEVIKDRAISASDPVADRADTFTEGQPGERLRFDGINSARGSSAEELGNLLAFDADGSRTSIVVPVLERLATDPVLSVRSQAAHTVAAALRFARPEAVAVFAKLVDADDALLAGQFVRRLIIYIGNGGHHNLVLPVIERMFSSERADVRQCGGELALVAALDWSARELLDRAIEGTDVSTRRGVAQAAAARLTSNRDVKLAGDTLIALFDDPDEDVRAAAAQVAPNLRGEALGPHESVLSALIDSKAFEAATPQLFITLEHAPDQVGALALRCAQRFIEVFGAAAGNIQTSAAGDSRYICDLVIRGLAQSHDPAERSALLDVVDELMKVGAYGVHEAVDGAER